ncbi:hypothetical protein CMI37_37035 [Candidatus Pacearchaeota archaeon]|nr:hypothetical protein [Candidatus Pacearchaeota archaeon]|tara:strand:+ start:2270 stop:4084 length:1815 start_codon:yes stop_codon:yes gene_type:complete
MNNPKHTWEDFGIKVSDRVTGQVATTCPVCSPFRKKSKLKTMGVNFNTKGWHCCHCDWAGSLWRGVTRPSNPSNGQAVQRVEYTPPSYEEPVIQPKVADFFKDRCISEETIDRFKINSGMHYMPQLEKEVFTIQFPYIQDGVVVNIKYRGPQVEGKKTFSQVKGAPRLPYNIDSLKLLGDKTINEEEKEVTADHFIIVEGEMDVLALYECGEEFVISVPDGAPPPNATDFGTKLDWLKEIEEYIDKINTIVIATDSDAPGYTLREELVRRIGLEKCYTVNYPNGCKDLNEVLIKHGRDAVVQSISQAKPYPISGIYTISHYEQKIDKLFKDGITPGMETQWRNIRDIYKVALGENTTVTGYQGSGKSELVEDMAISFARTKNMRVGIFSPEHPTEIHISRLAEKYTGKAWKTAGVVGDASQLISQEEWNEAKRWLNEHVYYIERSRSKPMTPEELLERKKMLVLRYGCQLFIDDPFNRMDHQRPKDMTTEEYISWFLEVYGEFDAKYKTHSWLIAHPRNPPSEAGLKTGTLIAKARDISGGAMWGNKSLNVVSVARKGIGKGTDEAGDQPTLFITQKIKFKWNGKLAMRELYFNPVNGRFRDEK